MLVFAAVLLATVVNAARLDNTYLPPQNSRNSGGSGHFLTPPFQQQHGKPSFQASGSGFPKFAGSASFGGASSTFNRQGGSYNRQAAHIPILRFDNKNNGDGSYQFKYETQNQISHEESGHANNDNQQVHGSYSYISPEGEHISVSYIADENGFQPSGAHIPTPPPVPEEILRSLELTAHRGDSNDDGQYRSSHHGNGNYAQNSFGKHSQGGYQQSKQYLPPSRFNSNNNGNNGYRY